MKYSDIVISSFKNDGSKFRPSDWVERLSSSVSRFTDKINSNYARACIIRGEKYFVVNSHLEQQNPNAYHFVIQFAQSNNLSMKQSSSHIGMYSDWSDFDDYSQLNELKIPVVNDIVHDSSDLILLVSNGR